MFSGAFISSACVTSSIPNTYIVTSSIIVHNNCYYYLGHLSVSIFFSLCTLPTVLSTSPPSFTSAV